MSNVHTQEALNNLLEEKGKGTINKAEPFEDTKELRTGRSAYK